MHRNCEVSTHAVRVLNRLAKLVCLLAALQVCGGHWVTLQSVAWVGMLVSYSRGEALAVAVEKTFDGEHPCGLCAVVKNGREQEQKQQVVKVMMKVDAVLAPTARLSAPLASEWKHLVSVPLVLARSLAPPTPPPQAA